MKRLLNVSLQDNTLIMTDRADNSIFTIPYEHFRFFFEDLPEAVRIEALSLLQNRYDVIIDQVKGRIYRPRTKYGEPLGESLLIASEVGVHGNDMIPDAVLEVHDSALEIMRGINIKNRSPSFNQD